jgi:hypothetical protein
LRRVLSLSWRRTHDAQRAMRRDRRDSSRFYNAVFTIAAVSTLFCAIVPVTASASSKPPSIGNPANTRKEPPKGPLQIVISVDQQKLHLYSDGMLVADTAVATGVADHPTPLGIFSIIQKSRDHHSNIYSNAPMPYMERLTWSGIALHEGFNLGHPASHGCIRVSHDFAVRLWGLTRLDVRVVIARPELRPENVSDPHLFAHKEKTTDADPAASLAPPPPLTPPLPAQTMAKLLKTAETIEGGQTSDSSSQRERDAAPPANPVQAAPANDPPVAQPSKPAETVHATKGPIAIFISRKAKKIYVRQNFLPLFDADVTIENPEQPLGTHVFTAMEYQDDGSSFRWNVISLPGEQPRAARKPATDNRLNAVRREGPHVQRFSPAPPPETPVQALARVTIPQDVMDQISELIVPGSSLIVSDQGLGEETGEGTNFIVVAH